MGNIVFGDSEDLNSIMNEQASIISAFSSVFFVLFIVDIRTNSFWQLFTRDGVSDAIGNEQNAKDALNRLVSEFVVPDYQEQMREFNDLTTLSERIKGKHLIEQDFLGKINGWSNACIIPYEYDENGAPYRFIFGTKNINEERQKEIEHKQILEAALEIERKSMLDPLTGSKNRLALNWAYEGDCDKESSISVMMVDLNGLKKINDSKGHAAGDEFICSVAKLLTETFGWNNVYRVGGDEFIIAVLGLKESDFVDKVGAFAAKCIEKSISVSYGYEFKADFYLPFEEIQKMADSYMYEAKREYYRKKGIDRRNTSELSRNNEYIDALIDYGTSCYWAAKINLSKNTYELIYIMEGYDLSFRSHCVTFSDLMNYPATYGYVHHEDKEDFLKYTSLEYLRTHMRGSRGKVDHWVKFRSKYGRDEYHVIQFQFIASREFSDDNMEGYILAKDMGTRFSNDRMLFEDVLKELSENFESIFYVDFDKDEVVPYRMNASITRKQGSSLVKLPTYWEAMGPYLENSVHEKDKETMYKVCQKSYIAEQLRTRRAFSHDYRAIIDGNEVYYRIKFSNMEGPGELHHCAVGFVNVNLETLLRREIHSGGKNVLIVENGGEDDCRIKKILGESYELFEAKNSSSAWDILEDSYEDIGLIIEDLEMPVSEGLDFLAKLKADRKYRDIPVIVALPYGDNENKSKCLELGAIDFIGKPYDEKLVLKRIESIVRLRDVTETLKSIEVDAITGLYSKEAFYTYAQMIIDANPDKEYCIEVSDIIGFKAINEQFGIETGNKVLKYLASIGLDSNSGMIMGGRIGSDLFAALTLKNRISAENDIKKSNYVNDHAPIPNLIVKFGYFFTDEDRSLSVQHMCDRALLALGTIKDKYGVVSATYNSQMREKLLRERNIIDNMEQALKEEQFLVYYQPKYDISNNCMAGAEALVRWIHPEMGFMNPGEFIPLFERNGFITELDKYVWKKVCEEIAYWLKEGIEIAVSVNISRKDFSDPNLADFITDLVDEYSIPHRLLHVEVTESAYAVNPEMLKNTIGILHKRGFIVELDDFGTGYSSLSALNGMDIDIIKLDMSIIRDDVAGQEKNVLDFSMQIAKMMKVQTVQEGVETVEQLNRVKSLGCDFVQGFYFSKPLPRNEFAEYIRKHVANR